MQRNEVLFACASIWAGMILVGCSSATGSSNGHMPPPEIRYLAFGDSITHGTTLSDPATQAYPALVAQTEGVAFANYAMGGNHACDVPSLQIFPNGVNPTLATPSTYSLLIGTNDADGEFAGPYEAVFILCHQAAISWLAIPAEYKVVATGSGVTTTGAGAIDTAYNWNSWTTGGLGSTVSFTIETRKAGPIYAWPRISNQSPATYTYSLDGVSVGSSSVEVNPSMDMQPGRSDSLGFLRLPNVPAGKHVVTFTQTNMGTNGVSVVGIGAPTGAAAGILPEVLAGTITYQNHPTGGKCTQSTYQPCQQYTADVEADVALFLGDGLNVRLFDTRKYMFGTSSEMNDAVHPNVLGQTELSQSVEASW